MKYIIQKISSQLTKKLKSYKLQASHGFTLIETLVAISILMIAVASPLTIAQKGLTSAIYAKDQITASYLAQDAIEYIRNKIDKNVAKNDSSIGWLDGISNTCNNLCVVDTSKDTISSCDNNNGCPTLKYDETSHIYSQVGANNSSFTRSVNVNEENTNTEALVTVKMSWKDRGSPRNFVVSTRLFNWR